MKRHFIILSTYTVPFEQLGENIAAHRAFLQTGYDMGTLLCSGPQNPKIGGVIIARGTSLEDVMQFMSEDPYNKKALATYQYIEFEPVKCQSFMGEWVGVDW